MLAKKALQAFKTEFEDIVEAIAEKLQEPPDDLPQGIVVEYDIEHLEALVRLLKLRLPTVPRIVNRRVRIPEGDLLLWHGTSEDRAQSILKWGFRAGRRKRGIFFSTNIVTSYSYSEGKDARDRSGPVVYDKARWKRFRLYVLKLNVRDNSGLCQHCNRNLADQVHHVQDVQDAPQLAFVAANCLAWCRPCHSAETSRRQGWGR